LDHNPSLYHYIEYFLDNYIVMTNVGQLHGLDLPNMPWEINLDEVGEFIQELWAKILRLIEDICLYATIININLKLNIFKFSYCKGYFTKVHKILLNPSETDRVASSNIHNEIKDKLRELHAGT